MLLITLRKDDNLTNDSATLILLFTTLILPINLMYSVPPWNIFWNISDWNILFAVTCIDSLNILLTER